MDRSNTFKSSVIGMQGDLMSFALKLTTNREEANDLVQDTCCKALDNESKYVENANFRGWMLTIMRNIFINNYRRSARENTIVDTTEDLYYLSQPQDAGYETPEGAFFSMHVAGYKYEEIAAALKMPLGTVKSRIFFTRKRLREILKDYR